jgi:predicted TIM-barrel fold metal-dependent hydrolase
MKKALTYLVAGCCIAAAALSPLWLSFASMSPARHASGQEVRIANNFVALDPIDTHTHVFKNDPAFSAMMNRLHLHVLDICVSDSHNQFRALQPEIASGLAFVKENAAHAALCTTFDHSAFATPDFAARTIQQLDTNFAAGAVAVKIWKNIGMELKTPDGKYVMPDDPAFDPIYQDIAAHNKTLIAHVAEPTICWRPLDPGDPSSGYYKQHPEWYMYGHSDRPSKETILAARDHLLEKHPDLRVVGAHLGSMELDVDEIARHFDRYPNFAVDTAARMRYLMLQPRDKVRNFLIKYADRVLYATDLEFQGDDSFESTRQEWEDTYARDWKFLATDETLEYKGRKIQGLALPPTVLQKLYHDNAVKWIPGIVMSAKN